MPSTSNELQGVIDALKQGKPVAIPTETVYGLAAPINNEKGLAAVFSMKNRPLNHPLIVHVAEGQDLNAWVDFIPDYAKLLMEAFWPGPLTLVFPAKAGVFNPLVTGGQDSVAIRCPDHPLTQALLRQVETPLVAPSANPFGKISPTTVEHVRQSFPKHELTILDGGRCSVGIESTLVDARDARHYSILRQGMITEKQLLAVAPFLRLEGSESLRAPGKLASHYQPEKPLYYFNDPSRLDAFCQEQTGACFVIARSKPQDITAEHFFPFPESSEKAAFELYYQLRKADLLKDVSALAIELPPVSSAWHGIRERIMKAGQVYPI